MSNQNIDLIEFFLINIPIVKTTRNSEEKSFFFLWLLSFIADLPYHA